MSVWMILRAGLRQRWRSWLALALLAGVFGGVVTATAAGARRTDTAYPRLLAWSRSPEVMFFFSPALAPAIAHLPFRAVARLPQAAAAARIGGFTVLRPASAEVLAPEDSQIPASMWRRKLLSGRLPDPRRAGEADVSFLLAQRLKLRVGGTLRFDMVSASGRPLPVRLRVVGIDAAPLEFPPQTGTGIDLVWTTPAFYRQQRSRLDLSPAIALRLRGGAAALPALLREARRLAGSKAANAYPLTSQNANTQHSIHLAAVALWLLTGLLAAVGLLTLGQLQARQSLLEATDYTALRSLGVSRRQLLAAGLGRAAIIGTAAGAAAVALAVAASPVFPLGMARTADPSPGLSADWLVLGLGAAGVLAATVGCAVVPAWRAATRAGSSAATPPAGRQREPALSRGLGGLRPVPGQLGVRLALSRGAGRTSLPVPSTIAGAAIGVAALTAAIVFTASLTHLEATPRLYGVTWDANISNLAQEAGAAGVVPAIPAVARDPQVGAWSAGFTGAPLSVGGVPAGGMAMGAGHGGGVLPVPIEGRLPRRPDEVALGARTLAAARTRLGATVPVALSSQRTVRFTVVGVAVFPQLSDELTLGRGAALTVPGLKRLLPPGAHAPAYGTMLVRFRPGPPGGQAQLASLQSRLGALGPYAVQPPGLPTDLVNFGQVHDLPLLLGGTLGGLALLTITHLLVTSVRRRRRDLAVLRTLGFTRGQVRVTVSWQAGTLVAAALVIGVPVGIVAGRLAWQLFTAQLGILPVPVIPAATLGLLVPGALALAVAVAALPAEAAASARPAQVLRAE